MANQDYMECVLLDFYHRIYRELLSSMQLVILSILDGILNLKVYPSLVDMASRNVRQHSQCRINRPINFTSSRC